MLFVREREDELSSVPWSRLRRPGSLPASLAAAAMAHSPVQAGLPGMQVRSCPKGRHGRAPRAGVGVRGGIPGAQGTGLGEKAPLGPGSAAGAEERDGDETCCQRLAWCPASSVGPVDPCLPLPPSIPVLGRRCVAAGVRSVACGPLPRPGVLLGVLIPEANRGSVGDFRPR